MFRRHKYPTKGGSKKRKPRRRAAKTPDSKAKSLQTSWRHATNRTESLSADEARKIVANPGECPYCKKRIPYRELSIDHKQPRSRGGADSKENLVMTCRSCNLSKGNLTFDEFTALMAFLDEWPEMKESVLIRLRAGGAAFRRRR